jgi:hypothetical protein
MKITEIEVPILYMETKQHQGNRTYFTDLAFEIYIEEKISTELN